MLSLRLGREAKLENVDARKNALQRCSFPMQKPVSENLASIKSYNFFPDQHFPGTISTWTQCTVPTKMVLSFWKLDISMNFWRIWIQFFPVARHRSQKASFGIFEFFWRFGRQVSPMLESEPKTGQKLNSKTVRFHSKYRLLWLETAGTRKSTTMWVSSRMSIFRKKWCSNNRIKFRWKVPIAKIYSKNWSIRIKQKFIGPQKHGLQVHSDMFQ